MEQITAEYTYDPCFDAEEGTPFRGAQLWYADGVLHRDGDEPAVVLADGSRKWYTNGALHRNGGEPAIQMTDGVTAWHVHGALHRDGDRPAFVSRLSQIWAKNNVVHRDSTDEYGNLLPARIFSNGGREYVVNGLYHNTNDNPALVYNDGSEWYCNDKHHREARDENGHVLPAMVMSNGYRAWYTHGVLHRDPAEGPAVINVDETVEYWVNGVKE